MNIIFQFGEFSGEESSKLVDLLIQIVASLIGAGSAILVFWLGLKNEREKEAKQKLEITHDKLRYVNYLLNGTLIDIRSQVKKIEQFIDEQSENLSKFVHYNINLKSDVERIVNNINQEDYFLAYVRVINDDNITILFYISELLDKAVEKVLKDIGSSAEHDYKLKLDFKTLIDNLVDNMSRYLLELKKVENYIKYEDLYHILNESILSYIEIVDKEPDNFLKIRDFFIVPLMPKLLTFRDIVEIHTIVDIASKANKSLTPILRNKEDLINDLKLTREDIDYLLEKFNQHLQPLNEYLETRKLKITRMEVNK